MDSEQEKALRLATEAGHILLENGAEISRVEETMQRMSEAYGVSDESFFVLSNGIIATGQHYARAEFIPIKGMQLSRVVEVNQLSREVAQPSPLPLAEVEHRLNAIRAASGKPWWELVLGIALGVASFSILFGGSLADAGATFACGIVLGLYMTFAGPHLSRIMGNLSGGLLGGLLCIATARLAPGTFHLPNMVIGTIIALVPGVPFTNGVRDIANEDYIAGATRLLDAFLAFLSIALGVIVALAVDGWLAGGLMELGTPATDPLTASWPIQLAAALVGTMGFSALFGTMRKHYVGCGLAGMTGWGVMLAMAASAPSVAAVFCGALAVAVISHLFAKYQRCPVTVFLICGIIPLVPGGGIFWTAYYLTSGRLALAATAGFAALAATVAIAGGIIIATAVFNKLSKHHHG